MTEDNAKSKLTLSGKKTLTLKNLGDARKAIEYHEQALAIDREVGDRRGEGADLGNLGGG